MLRRPPTAIVIVASEVRAYEERRQARRHAFQSGNSIKSVSEVESNDPERNSSSPGADVKTGGSDTNDFSDALAPSPDPSVLGNGEQDELAKALNNLAQGRSIIFESPSLSVRLKATQPDGTVLPSEDNSLIPDTPIPRMEDLDEQPTANEASESHQIEMGLRTQRHSIRSSRHMSLDMTLSTPPASHSTMPGSPSSLPRVSWLNTRSVQRHATVSSALSPKLVENGAYPDVDCQIDNTGVGSIACYCVATQQL